MTKLTIDSTVTLLSGVEMPRLGFGVFESGMAEQSTASALREGYRQPPLARCLRVASMPLTACSLQATSTLRATTRTRTR